MPAVQLPDVQSIVSGESCQKCTSKDGDICLFVPGMQFTHEFQTDALQTSEGSRSRSVRSASLSLCFSRVFVPRRYSEQTKGSHWSATQPKPCQDVFVPFLPKNILHKTGLGSTCQRRSFEGKGIQVRRVKLRYSTPVSTETTPWKKARRIQTDWGIVRARGWMLAESSFCSSQSNLHSSRLIIHAIATF